MSAFDQERYNTIEDSQKAQPKVDSGIKDTKPWKSTSAMNDKLKRTIEVNLAGLKSLGITNPLKEKNITPKNTAFIAADDMITNAEIQRHFE